MAKKKQRLDLILKEKGIVPTRSKAQALIMAGAVWVNGKPVTKAGHLVNLDDEIILKDKGCPYVSRAGLKLEKALRHFEIKVREKICLDVGASTGGFTHCLLKHGAKLVYAVDVGYGQLDWRLRNRKDVINIERTNIRYLDPRLITEEPDIATIDTSFISLKIVVPSVVRLIKDNAEIVALIKPQFEAGREKIGKGGIIRDSRVHDQVIDELVTFFKKELSLNVKGLISSPILGAKGNKEFLIHLVKKEV